MSTLMRKRTATRAGGGMNKRLKRLERKVASQAPEKKYKQTDLAYGGAANEVDFDLSDIAQGTNTNQRIGAKVRLHRLRIQATCPDSVANARMVVYVPKDATDSLTAAYDDALDYDRAWILHDSIKQNGDTSNSSLVFTFEKQFGPLGMIEEFDAVTAASVTKNPIRVRFMSNAPTQPMQNLDGNATCWYTDP